MTARSITFSTPDADIMEEFTALVGHREFFRAVGYLSTWCLETYPSMTITVLHMNTQQPEIVASYAKSNGERGYVIGAVWNPDTKAFGFHS